MKLLKNYLFTLLTGIVIISCSENESVCPDENHPHAIDLGLPSGTKWACCNVGAPSPENAGGYYAWSETEVKSDYTHNVSNLLALHNIINIARTQYDVAQAKMGLSYAMPTLEEWKELKDYCDWKWGKYKGTSGRYVTGPNGKKVFLPAGGGRYGSDPLYGENERGAYWAADYNVEEEAPFCFEFHNGYCWSGAESRPCGYNVRAILR